MSPKPATTHAFSLARLVLLLCFLFTASAISFAQGTRGTIQGEVTDPNGSVVANATVKLIDATRNLELRTVQTDSDGSYQFLEVDPGVYNIIVSAANFAETRLTDVKVEPNRNLRIDPKLTLGTASANVTVSATEELVDRESPTLGTTVDNRRVVGLPKRKSYSAVENSRKLSVMRVTCVLTVPS